MTVSNTSNSVREAGNGSKTAFDFSFPIYNSTDLKVYKINTDTEERTLLTLTTDYTVEISTSAEGGTVTYVVAPTASEDSFIERELPYTQATNIPAVGGVREEQLEKGLDKLCILALQLLKKAKLSLKFISSSTQEDVEVPEPEAGKGLRWASSEDALENYDIEAATATDYLGTIAYGADASKAASPSSGDIYTATDSGRVYVCYTAGTWTDITGTNAVADIASATTCDLGGTKGKYLRVTGTTTITGFGTSPAGTLKIVRFAGVLTLTYNATSLILPGAASITTAAGDVAVMSSEGSGNWRCLSYSKADGTAVAVNAVATQAEMEAASSTTAVVTPGRAKYHPGMAKAWVTFDGTSGSIGAGSAAYNVSSITDNGLGDYTVNFTTAFSSANYAVMIFARAADVPVGMLVDTTLTKATGSVRFTCNRRDNGVAIDPSEVSVVVFGDQ